MGNSTIGTTIKGATCNLYFENLYSEIEKGVSSYKQHHLTFIMFIAIYVGGKIAQTLLPDQVGVIAMVPKWFQGEKIDCNVLGVLGFFPGYKVR